ncbi:MAG: TonB-dependent receptor, partial [Planctomycetota bacterium]
ETPYPAESVGRETIERRSYRSTPQILRNLPGVLVQETSFGQGSPYIRGFTGFRNLFLIDGIRLNNSVFRPGPNQYWNTVDPLSLDRIEVIKGPSSVLYGSDAIGGTVQAVTKNPYSYGPGLNYGGRVFYRAATAENSHVGRAELSLSTEEQTGLLVGGGVKEFGDLIAGDPVDRQTHIGYDEWNTDLKLEHFLDEDTRLVLAYQHVRQNNVPRSHKTVFAKSFAGTTVGSELRRDLDQERSLLYAQFHREKMEGFIDTVRASVSWQTQEETRDRIRPPSGGGPGPNRRDQQGFEVGTLGLWTQLESPTAWGRLTYGVEYYHDNVNSFSSRNPVQGPVGDDASYDLLGLYVQDVVDLDERLELTVGGRLTFAATEADRVSDPVTGNPIRVDEDWTAVVGSARLRYHLVPDHWNLYGGVSQGFRAPNLSDLTRFDSARTNEFEIPAPGLDPEHTLTFELGVKGRGERYSLQSSVFYTDIRDQIVRFPTGNTNLAGENEVTKQNIGDGFVYGIELAGAWEPHPQWTLFGNLTFLEGEVDTFPTSARIKRSEYLDRLMPLSAQVGARWEDPGKRFWAEGLVLMADRADKLSTRDRADTQRIPPGGTPGYGVLHLRAGWRIRKGVELTLGIENVLDKSYRVHGSGHNMPGLNF